jgi:hypothetical protein
MICDVSVISYWTARAESLSNTQNQCTSFMQNNSCYLKFFLIFLVKKVATAVLIITATAKIYNIFVSL